MCARLDHLASLLSELDTAGVDWLHLDVMDGSFVPNFALGANLIRDVRRLTRLPLEAHLMVQEPHRHVRLFRDLGVEMFTFHYEACRHPAATVRAVRQAGLKAGLALSPGTPAEAAKPLLSQLDLILIMATKPGFPAQSFDKRAVPKVARVREWLASQDFDLMVGVDGAVNASTVPQLVAAGAEYLVGGSSGLFTRTGEKVKTCCRYLRDTALKELRDRGDPSLAGRD